MIISAIFAAILIVLLAVHFAYPSVLKRLSKKHTDDFGIKRMNIESPSDLPMVSILIPVYNEESVIEYRINNIYESNYPQNKIEIIIIDSGSSDKTRHIIRSKFSENVTLITEEERRGKANAINLGLQSCNGEIIILTDGTAIYDKETLMHLVNPFRNNTIGAVSASYDVPNSSESHVSASERKFWTLKDSLRVLESIVYSTSWLSGEACAFRNKVIEAVDQDSLADDSNIALQFISKGHKVVVNQNARFKERSPTEFSDYIKVKSRRALGGLLETVRFKSFLFNRRYGHFGTIIFPYRFFVCILSPILVSLLMGLAIPTIFELVSKTGILSTVLLGIGLVSIFILFKDLFLIFFYTQLITTIALFWWAFGERDVRWTRSKTR
jgi:cellulose synthase/poly-beta-1,6-N-acetylglucosamine synthase-like glycosyltransferase